MVFCTALACMIISTTLLVPDEYATIQFAIDAALDGDTVLVSQGTYNESINFLGKSIFVSSVDGPNVTTILAPDTASSVVSFTLSEDSLSVLCGFSITSPETWYATGIYCESSGPTIMGNTIHNIWYNAYDMGGGITCYNANPIIINNVIQGNHSMAKGGGIALFNCGGIIAGNQITQNNIGSYSSPSFGGGCYLKDCVSVQITGNIINGNHADRTGYPWYYPGKGGGFYLESCSDIEILNNVLVQNSADNEGGGLCVLNSSGIVILNSIIRDNTSYLDIGKQLYGDETSATMSYCNVSLWEDTVGVIGVIPGTGMIDEDPEFELGSLSNYHLSPISPCIDSGNPVSQFNDPEDPSNPGYALWPAMGLVRNDMGAYGGSGAEYWVATADFESRVVPQENNIYIAPNPFDLFLNVSFLQQSPSPIELAIFDTAGRKVDTIHYGQCESGMHSFTWIPSAQICNGYYFVVLSGSEFQIAKPVILIR